MQKLERGEGGRETCRNRGEEHSRQNEQPEQCHEAGLPGVFQRPQEARVLEECE